jgi:DNA repair exonuclease SbcCD nuclease subunit
MGRTYCLISDVHAVRRPPASCTETYLPDLFELLNQAARLCYQREAEALIIAGDLFHAKAPSKTDHGLVRALIDLFRSVSCPVWVVPGNHDMSHDRMASIDATQPLGVLFSSGAAHCLDGWMGGNHPVFGVPWQQRWSAERVAECLRPWREYTPFEATSEHYLVVTHAPVYPPGSEPRYEGAELTPADWWVSAAGGSPGAHSVFYGHIHEPHGVWERAGVRFCNNGALSRGSLDEYNLQRQVGVTLWDEDSGGFEFVPLQARPAEQVFRLREREQVVTAQARLDDFLAEIGRVTLPRMTPDSVMAAVRRASPGPEAVALADELVEWAEHERR